MDNSKLTDEISEKRELTSNFWVERFKDDKIEEEFNSSDVTFIKAGYIICVMNFFAIGSNIYYSYYRTQLTNFIVIICLCLVIDLILFYIMIKTKINSKYNFSVRMIYFLFNLLYFYAYFLVIMIFVSENKIGILTKTFFIDGFILLFLYLFVIRRTSKFICLSIYIGYILLFILATLTTKEVFVIFSNNERSNNYFDCSSILDYKKMMSMKNENSYFDSKFIKKLYLNLTNTAKLNKTIDDFNTNLDRFYEENEEYDKEIAEYNKYINLLETNFQYAIPKAYINFIGNNSTSIYDCYNYYNGKYINYVFMTFPNLEMKLESEIEYGKYSSELICCLFSYIIFIFCNHINYSRREKFIKMKETEVILQYLNQLINNMQSQIISFNGNKVIFYNEKFSNSFNSKMYGTRKKEDKSDLESSIKANDIKANNNFSNEEYHSNQLLIKNFINNNNASEMLKTKNANYYGNIHKNSSQVDNNPNNNVIKSDIIKSNNAATNKLIDVKKQDYDSNSNNSNNENNNDCNIEITNYFKNFFMEIPSQSKYIIDIQESSNKENYNDYINMSIEEIKEYVNTSIINKTNINLYDLLKLICKKAKNSIFEEYKESKNNFQFLGIFHCDSKNYKVNMRKFFHKKDKFILDLMIDDITEIKKAERIDYESKYKQKLFSKMAFNCY